MHRYTHYGYLVYFWQNCQLFCSPLQAVILYHWLLGVQLLLGCQCRLWSAPSPVFALDFAYLANVLGIYHISLGPSRSFVRLLGLNFSEKILRFLERKFQKRGQTMSKLAGMCHGGDKRDRRILDACFVNPDRAYACTVIRGLLPG